MKGGLFKRNVNPRIVAIAIILVLGAVQWWWWSSLVAKRPGLRPGPGGPAGGGPVQEARIIRGRQDVLVDTLAGAPQPGFIDGPGHRARFDGPSGLAIDHDGALLVADTRNHRIRRVDPAGTTTTIAGAESGFRDGPATEALFNAPCGIRAEP